MIGWYVHHQGTGHLRRCQTVVAELDVPVTVLSSLIPDRSLGTDWFVLADDADGHPEPSDVTARGTLHWAPRHHRGLAARSAQLTAWIRDVKPSLLVVDVSVEVSILARLTGTPVLLVAMPGDRSDRAHATAYDLADGLIAAWPEQVATTWPSRWREKTHFVGLMSRFDGRTPTPKPQNGKKRALLLWGAGGEDRSHDVAAMQAATPEWHWQLAHPAHRMDDDEFWDALNIADVVVTHAGQGALGDVAAVRAPAIVVADPRPFDEQLHTARALTADGVAVGLEDWPAPHRWPGLLEQARTLGGQRWQDWSSGSGAARAARAVEVHAGACIPTLSRAAVP